MLGTALVIGGVATLDASVLVAVGLILAGAAFLAIAALGRKRTIEAVFDGLDVMTLFEGFIDL